MVAKKPGLCNELFSPKGASVEKCARIGLYRLMLQTSKATDFMQSEPGFENFRTEVQTQYEKVATPKLSKWKIALSVMSIGLIPLINVIIALVKTKLTKEKFEELTALDHSFVKQMTEAASEPQVERNRLAKEYTKIRTPVAKQYFAYTEGITYRSALPV